MRRVLKVVLAVALVVEAAIVTPVVMVLLFGMIELGFVFKDYLAVAGAVRAGVRTASANPRVANFAQVAANKVAQTLYDGCDSLENFPRRGRKGRLEGTRELVFAGLPYIVVYRIQDQDLEILRIYHGAQDWP